jgi:site-specific recombinase XerD
LELIESELIVEYIRSRTTFHARSSVCGVVSVLRGMGEFLVIEGLWSSNPLRWIRGPKIDRRAQVPRRIGKEDLHRLWSAAQSRRSEFARYQAVCILAMLYSTGIRRGELLRLSVDDWNREEAILKIDGRKTGSARHVPVGAGVWRCIEAYLPYRHNILEKMGRVGEVALLVNTRGRRLEAAHVSTMLKRLATSAQVPRVTMHQFRHSCASDLLESGVSLPEVQQILGHAFIVSTMRYIDVADPARAAAIANHPLNDLLQNAEMRIAS